MARSRTKGGLLSIAALVVVALVVTALSWLSASRRPAALSSLPLPGAPAVRSAVYPGFDVSEYPGDATMRRVRDRAPYRFVGYYLVSDNHPGASWRGRWKALAAMGWSVIVIYVGRQHDDLTDEQAQKDAVDAAEQAHAEGFPEGAIIYLDVEATDDLGDALKAYANAWTRAVSANLRRPFRPGLYCHVKNARALAEAVGALDRDIPLWVAGGADFALDAPPGASGIASATAWQGWLDVDDPTGTVGFPIDVSTALSPTPSGF